jgi:hypothetical protein
MLLEASEGGYWKLLEATGSCWKMLEADETLNQRVAGRREVP